MHIIKKLIDKLALVIEQEGEAIHKYGDDVAFWLAQGHKLSEFEYEKEFNEWVREHKLSKQILKGFRFRYHLLKKKVGD